MSENITKETLLSNIKDDFVNSATLGVASTIADEFFFQKPRKDGKGILLVVGKEFVVSSVSLSVGDITEAAVNNSVKEKTYGNRLLARLSGSTAAFATQTGIRYLFGEKIEAKTVIKKGALNLVIASAQFAFSNLNETAQLISPYSKSVSDALSEVDSLINQVSF